MTAKERELLRKFRELLEGRLRLHSLVAFGSRARGDAEEDSDLDVLVVVDEPETSELLVRVFDCAWECDFGSGIVIGPIVVSRERWENGPERSSLLALAVRREGIPV